MTEHGPVTIADLLQLKAVDDAQVSPDGRQVAFVLTEAPADDDGKAATHLWIVPAGGDAPPRMLTAAGPHADRHPRWSPDGSALAFLSTRGDERLSRAQVHLLPVAAGGEAIQLTAAGAGVGSFAWSPDGREIAYLAADDPDPGAEKAREAVVLYEEEPCRQRLRVQDVATRAVRDVTPPGVQVWEFEWSPDGSQFALVVSDQPYEWSWYEARLARVPAAGGDPVTVCRPIRQVSRPIWWDGGREIAFVSGTLSDRGSVGGDVFSVPAAGGEARDLTPDFPGSFSWLTPHPDGWLLACGYAGFDGFVARLEPAAGGPAAVQVQWRDAAAFLPRSQGRASLSADGRTLAAVLERAGRPPDVWTGTLAGGGLHWQPVTDVNPWVRERALGVPEILRWEGPGGLEIEGMLVRPPGLAPGQRWPLVVYVHGGPTWAYGNRFSQGFGHLLAGMGCAVLLPNPRGSTGRGLAFAEANLGDMGGADFGDIMAGVDACIDRGVADPDRLGIAGWSYGGFMSAWAITRTERFRAAVVGAAVTNWLSFHGTTNIHTWDVLYQRLQPLDPKFAWNSPVHHAGRVRTPALVLHGGADDCVPPGQGYEFWRALRERGVETVLAIYPGAGHGPSKRPQVRDMAERITGWFCRHLGFGPAAGLVAPRPGR